MSSTRRLPDLITPLLKRLDEQDFENFQDILSQFSLDDLIKLISACSYIQESSVNLYTGYSLIQDALQRAQRESKFHYDGTQNFSNVLDL